MSLVLLLPEQHKRKNPHTFTEFPFLLHLWGVDEHWWKASDPTAVSVHMCSVRDREGGFCIILNLWVKGTSEVTWKKSACVVRAPLQTWISACKLSTAPQHWRFNFFSFKGRWNVQEASRYNQHVRGTAKKVLVAQKYFNKLLVSVGNAIMRVTCKWHLSCNVTSYLSKQHYPTLLWNDVKLINSVNTGFHLALSAGDGSFAGIFPAVCWHL